MVKPSEQNARRLNSLAETKFKAGDIESAIYCTKSARRLSPSLPGLSEMITCFKILHAAANDEESTLPDHYRILQVEPFSRVKIIKKQYKKLALSLHADKESFSLGSEEAIKVVDDAIRGFSDKIRKKEYDSKLASVIEADRSLNPKQKSKKMNVAADSL